MHYISPFKTTDTFSSDFSLFKKGVIIFGTGNLGALCLHALKQKDIEPICFVDNNYSNWDKNFNGYKIISPEKLKKDYSNSLVIISSLNFKYLIRQLKSLGIKNVHYCDSVFSNFNLESE